MSVVRSVFLGKGLPRKRNPSDPGDASYFFDFRIVSAAPGGFLVAETKDLQFRLPHRYAAWHGRIWSM